MKPALFPYLTIAVMLLGGPLRTAAQSPTPTCNPTYLAARFDNTDPDPTYYPNDRITLTILPRDVSDWPTTPTRARWRTLPDNYSVNTTTTTRTFTIIDPAPDTFYVYAQCWGDGIRPDCADWWAANAEFRARRFDYNPTPSPTVSPTPSATPTPDCTPDYCMDSILYPPQDLDRVPHTAVLQLALEATFYGLETVGGQPFPVTPLGDNRFLAENMLPDTWYGMLVACTDSCTGSPRSVEYFFLTELAPTPTPSPVPTAPPSPTPPAAGNGWFVHGEDGATTNPGGDPASHTPLSRPDRPAILDQLLSILIRGQSL